MLDAEEHACRIDRHDAVPGFRAVKILLGAAGDPGIVHKYIQLAEPARSGSHDGGPVFLAGDVEAFEPRRRADRIGHLLPFMRHHIRDHDLGAFAREHACGGSAHARCRPGYDRDLAREPHGCFPQRIGPTLSYRSAKRKCRLRGCQQSRIRRRCAPASRRRAASRRGYGNGV
jgi:hypothetical protein